MTTKIFTQHAQASQIAAACTTALIANYKLFTDALKMAATPPADAVILAGYVEPEGLDWNAAIEQLKKAKDHAMRSISALHIAAVENRDEMLLDASQATAQHALACLKSALALHAPLRAAVTKCSMLGGDTIYARDRAYLAFQIDIMRERAKESILIVEASARKEAALAEAQAEVFGKGEHEFEVMVTLQTTAHRFIHVRADGADAARDTALEAARDQQGAHFVLNEGNQVAYDDLHANAVYDSNGHDVWNDDPAFRDSSSSADTPSM